MADTDEPLGVVISAREIYDEIVGMRDDVRSLAQSSHETTVTLKDHEARIRVLERWKYGIPGVVALSAVAAAVQVFK